MNEFSTGGRRFRRPKAADYLGVSTEFLEKAAVKGGGPAYFRLSSRLVVYDIADLDAWLAAHRVQSSAEGFERERITILGRGPRCSPVPNRHPPDLSDSDGQPKNTPTKAPRARR
jgi:hypothetical protein